MHKTATLLTLTAALLLGALACEKEASTPVPGVNPPAEAPKAEPPKAEPPKEEAPKAVEPPKEEPPKEMGGAAPAAADGLGDLKPGENRDSFLEGIDGEGSKLMTLIETDKGNIECELFTSKAPETVKNFVGLARGLKPFMDPATQQFVKRPFYDGIAFHRVIPQFMVQVGDPNGRGDYSPGYRFNDEIAPDLRHDKGALLSMANAGPGTNGSQFFITEVATPWLDGKHAIFGECTRESVKVVETLARVPTGPGNKPLEPLTIRKVTFRKSN